MKTIDTGQLEELVVRRENVIVFPLGILGFEHIKKYVLLANPEEDPFLWLQVIDDANCAFLVIHPSFFLPEYSPELSDEDVRVLNLETPDEAIVLTIVTLGRDGSATANLKGPIVINRRTLVGRQIIPINAASLDVHHPLPVEGAL